MARLPTFLIEVWERSDLNPDNCQVGKAVRVGPNWDGRPLFCYCRNCEEKRSFMSNISNESKVITSMREYGQERYDAGYASGKKNIVSNYEDTIQRMAKTIQSLDDQLSCQKRQNERAFANGVAEGKRKAEEAKIELDPTPQQIARFLGKFGISGMHKDGSFSLRDEPIKLRIQLACGTTLELMQRGF